MTTVKDDVSPVGTDPMSDPYPPAPSPVPDDEFSPSDDQARFVANITEDGMLDVSMVGGFEQIQRFPLR